MYAPKNGSFCGAVMATHAGWRGTAKKIAAVALERAIELGADPKTVKVAIGPSIGTCCYSVKQDFYDEFSSLAGKAFADRFIYKDNVSDTLYADLKSANRQILLDTGVLPENIDVSDMCTCCNPSEFFSHRYSKGKRGTMLSVITMDGIEK